jgi:hypothetical protein
MFRWTVIGLVGFLVLVLTFVWLGERYGLLHPVAASPTAYSAPTRTLAEPGQMTGVRGCLATHRLNVTGA